MIKFLLALDMEGKIKRLEVLSQNETEGLGSYVASEKWKNLWIGRDSSYIFDKSIDATTGATFTYLNSYKTIIKVLESYDELIGKDSLELENVDFLDLEPIDF
jgi:electron transport complex protein RnfG